MVTKQAGGKITGLLALTMEAQEALSVGDFVHIVGDYEVEIADGTKPVLGHVSVSNKNRRVSTAFSTSVANAEVPGACTVEARGFYVKTVTLGGTVAAGDEVAVNATGEVVAATAPTIVGSTDTYTAGSFNFGIALTGGVDGDEADILVR